MKELNLLGYDIKIVGATRLPLLTYFNLKYDKDYKQIILLFDGSTNDDCTKIYIKLNDSNINVDELFEVIDNVLSNNLEIAYNKHVIKEQLQKTKENIEHKSLYYDELHWSITQVKFGANDIKVEILFKENNTILIFNFLQKTFSKSKYCEFDYDQIKFKDRELFIKQICDKIQNLTVLV